MRMGQRRGEALSRNARANVGHKCMRIVCVTLCRDNRFNSIRSIEVIRLANTGAQASRIIDTIPYGTGLEAYYVSAFAYVH